MGEPAALGERERATARQLAREVVESVRNDEEFPMPFSLIGAPQLSAGERRHLEVRLLQMAQLIDAPYELTAHDRDAIGMHARDFAKWLALGDADGNARSFEDIVYRLERLLASEIKHRGEPPVRRRL